MCGSVRSRFGCNLIFLERLTMSLHVLMIIDSLDPRTGGPARSLPSLCNRLIERGVEVQIFVADEGEGNASGKKRADIPVNNFRLLETLSQKLQAKAENKVVIHNHGIWLPVNHHASYVASLLKIPLLCSPRGMLEPWARRYRGFKKKLAWYLYQKRDLKKATAFHATSLQEAENLEKIKLGKPIFIIANGVAIPHFVDRSVKDRDVKTVLFLSRIHPVKGIMDLVRAWNVVRPADWRVVVVGPDENNYRKTIEDEVCRLNLQDYFSFLGPASDETKWSLYGSADLFVLPTYSENFGIVVAEALGCGLPVITTTGAPWSELVTRKCGWWVKPGTDSLSRALFEATSVFSQDLEAMGQRGRQLVLEKYSVDRVAGDMIEVYRWLSDKDNGITETVMSR